MAKCEKCSARLGMCGNCGEGVCPNCHDRDACKTGRLMSLTLAALHDVVSRAKCVIEESDDANEHAELRRELVAVEDLCARVIGGSNMGCAADEVVLRDGDE